MGGEDDPLIDLAGEFGHHIVALALILPLVHGKADAPDAALHQVEGVPGVHIHAGELVAAGHIAPQLLFVHVPVGVEPVAVVGDEAQRAVGKEVLIEEVAHAGVQQHDLSPDAPEGQLVVPGHVVQLRLHLAAAAAAVALAGDLPAIGIEAGAAHLGHGHGEGLHGDLRAQRGAALFEILRHPQLLRGAAGVDEVGVLEYFPDLLEIHGRSLPVYIFWSIFQIRRRKSI